MTRFRAGGLLLAAVAGLSLVSSTGANAEQAGYLNLCRNSDGTSCVSYSPALTSACRPVASATYQSAVNSSSQGQYVYASHNCKGARRYLPPGSSPSPGRVQSYNHS
ncbi:hypothetical protein [Actinomadura litoris]|uniref:hypothetical protein n=1 Tax=Actinomadura litoris TaxID=2678616 RepID=UPI001FA7D924|nr:hypothetical protein [Actinomadura litoris]